MAGCDQARELLSVRHPQKNNEIKKRLRAQVLDSCSCHKSVHPRNRAMQSSYRAKLWHTAVEREIQRSILQSAEICQRKSSAKLHLSEMIKRDLRERAAISAYLFKKKIHGNSQQEEHINPN